MRTFGRRPPKNGRRPQKVERQSQKPMQRTVDASIVAAFSFIAVVGISVLATALPYQILVIYVGASFFTFVLYLVDKRAAEKGAWRIQESTLQLLALIGGWPGAIVAQQWLRHKTRKQSFQSNFWVMVLLNCGALIWLFTPKGSLFLQSAISRLFE